MITIGRYTFKPWLKGLGAAPRTPAVLCLVKVHHANRAPEVLSVQPVSDLRAGLADITARGGLSRAITEHGGSPGSGVKLAALECTSLSEARAIARELLSPPKRSARASDGGKHPDLGELLAGVRSLHREIVSQAHRRTLRQVCNLLKTLG